MGRQTTPRPSPHDRSGAARTASNEPAGQDQTSTDWKNVQMPTKRPTPRDGEDRPALRVPLSVAQQVIDKRIAAGQRLDPAHNPIQSEADLKLLKRQSYTWSDYNAEWIELNIGKTVAAEYKRAIPMYASASGWQQDIKLLQGDLELHLRRLESIRERLPLWADAGTESRASAVDSEGPIFVVHGRDEGKAQFVARVLERGTGRDVTILHERPNKGRTLIEKFEHHAERASFAVVVLTGDDEGGLAGSGAAHRPRGRQNVIFELGFFFALLGRERVVVLTQPDDERPSDVDGLVYIDLDGPGAWKQALARELDAAGIAVKRERMP
jgi:predicted nucleotide-binding protein